MDHILDLPSDPAFPPVIVPYIPGGSYDNQGLAGFPSRKGWDLTKLYAGDLQGRSVLDARRLLQNWLYFGTLSEFLDSTLDVDGFVCEVEDGNVSKEGGRGERGGEGEEEEDDKALSRPQLRISTKSLEKRLDRWVNRIKDLDIRADIGKQRMEQILDSIDFVSKATRDPVLTKLMGSELHLAVCVLGSTLDKARLGMRIYAPPELGLWSRGQKQHDVYYRFGSSKLLVDRLRSNGWCPNQLVRMEEDSTPVALYYISLLKRPDGIVSHIECCTDFCMANQVDESVYETKHVQNGCDCQHLIPDMQEVARIIEAGNIPLIGIRPGEHNQPCQVRVVSASPTFYSGIESPPYVAISHVWRDGLGNAHGNSLPSCQFQRLKRLVDGVYNKLSSYHNPKLQEKAAVLGDDQKSLDDLIYKMKATGFANPTSGMQKFLENVRPLLRDLSKQKADKNGNVGLDLSQLDMNSLMADEDFRDTMMHIRTARTKNPVKQQMDGKFHYLITDSPSRDFMAHHGDNGDYNFDWKAYDLKEMWDISQRWNGMGDEVFVWLDTLCIPLAKNLRKKAIKKMKEVYAHAEKVLVLDSELEQVSGSRSFEESLMRINLSGWMQRAWTLEEAAVGSILLFQFADGVFSIWNFARTWFRRGSRSIVLADACRPWVDIRRLQTPRHHVQQMQMAYDALEHRITSKRADLNIIFSFLMGVHIRRLLGPRSEWPERAKQFQELQDKFSGFMWVSNEDQRLNYLPVAISNVDGVSNSISASKHPEDSRQYFSTLSHLDKDIAPYRESTGYVLRCAAINVAPHQIVEYGSEVFAFHLSTQRWFQIIRSEDSIHTDVVNRRDGDTAAVLIPFGLPEKRGEEKTGILISFYMRTHLGGNRLTRAGVNFSTFRSTVKVKMVTEQVETSWLRQTDRLPCILSVSGKMTACGMTEHMYREDTMWCLE